MEERSGSRLLGLIAVVLIGMILIRLGLRFVSLSGLPIGRVAATRVMGGAYLLCDGAISFSLISLLLISDRRAPAWFERRLPFVSRWLWHFLLSLAILSYLALAPTFLYFLVRLERMPK